LRFRDRVLIISSRLSYTGSSLMGQVGRGGPVFLPAALAATTLIASTPSDADDPYLLVIVGVLASYAVLGRNAASQPAHSRAELNVHVLSPLAPAVA
jgi:hypothetical protein